MVAKSFQNFTQICDPYEKNGKMYVDVINPSTGSKRSVRWYSDYEYAKLYPEDAAKRAANKPSSQKEALGFQKGYITIFKGDTYPHLEWFQEKKECRYCTFWGWYVVSTEEVPADVPSEIIPVQLNWEDVGQGNGALKSETAVKNAVDALIYDPSPSQWIGSMGERLELTLTVTRAIELETGYGGTMHIMEDEEGNVFVWSTNARSWPEGSEHKIKGTVKDHSTYRNTRQTILTRCTEVK